MGSTVFWDYFEVFAANAADKILNEVVIVITLQNVVSVFIVRVSTSTLRLQLTYKFFLIQYLRFPLRVCVASHRVLARLPDLLKAHHFKSSRWFRRGCFCRWWPVKQSSASQTKRNKVATANSYCATRIVIQCCGLSCSQLQVGGTLIALSALWRNTVRPRIDWQTTACLERHCAVLVFFAWCVVYSAASTLSLCYSLAKSSSTRT